MVDPIVNEAHAPSPVGRPRVGLGARLVMLAIGFVLFAEVVIFIPSITGFRNDWLRDRLAAAYTAALVFTAAPSGVGNAKFAADILTSVGARTIVLKTRDTRRLLAVSDMPPKIDETFDLRSAGPLESVAAALRCLMAPDGRILNVTGAAPMGAEYIEIAIDEAPLRKAMFAFSVNILLMSLAISSLAAALAFLALHFMVLSPVRRLTTSIMAFGADPENARLIIEPSGQRHEIGMAEEALATMQQSLARELNRSRHLSALGLAVAKINHDLRNILTSAQLLSDRLAMHSDPVGQSLAPRLVATLDRAIAYCQSTLNYGKAAEPAPKLADAPLRPLVDEVVRTLQPTGGGSVELRNDAPDGLAIRADPEQAFRVLLNLSRNSVDALETAGPRPGAGSVVRLSARRTNGLVVIEIADSGPGVPERARARLFRAFEGGARPGGVGLGLAIASDIARAHGAEITLAPEAAPDLGGALFRIAWPAAADTA